MKNKLLAIMFTALLAAVIAGCRATTLENANSISFEEVQSAREETNPVESGNEEKEEGLVETENAAIESSSTEDAETEENLITESESAEARNLTYADLAQWQFEFCSGAGGWVERFTIEKDGFFMGLFNDSDMGISGEGYTNGTQYRSSYTGHFSNLAKVNEYMYTMELSDISYREAVDMEEIIDNVRYIYTDSYCLGEADTFTIYLPGTPLDELSEDIWSWIAGANQSEEELTMIVIADETNGYGIYSYDRLGVLEEAQEAFDSCKYSYDYYSEMFSEADTTVEMVEYSAAMYKVSDECLNYIWNLIRYHVEEDRYDGILTEQRAWISEKEAAAEEERAEYEDGTFASVSCNHTLAILTMKRCKELLGYLE